MTESTEKSVLSSCLKELESLGGFYVVLRNWATLPDSLGGSDLDVCIWLERGVLGRNYSKHVVERLRKAGICFIFYGRILGAPKIGLIGYDKEKRWDAVQMDVFLDGVFFHNVEMLRQGVLKKHKIEYQGVSVLDKDIGNLLSLIKENLNNGVVAQKYWDAALSGYLKLKYNLDEMIPIVNRRYALCLESMFLRGEFPSISDLVKLQHLWFIPLHERISNLYNRAYDGILRFFRRPGITIAFLGCDGAGKTTVIDVVRPVLEKLYHHGVFYEHMRPNWLPQLGAIAGRSSQIGPTLNPHASKPSGRMMSCLRLGYYWLDYTIGFFLKIYPRLVRKACCFVFDRYYSDFWIDPLRARLSLPVWLVRMMELFVPNPDITFCLVADVEKILNRKPELPRYEVERQIHVFQQLASERRGYHLIDTGKTIATSQDDVLKVITSFLKQRYK